MDFCRICILRRSRSQGLLFYQEPDPEGKPNSAQDPTKDFKEALIFLYYCFLWSNRMELIETCFLTEFNIILGLIIPNDSGPWKGIRKIRESVHFGNVESHRNRTFRPEPFPAESFPSEPFPSESLPLADSVTGHFGQTMKSCRNLTLMQSRAF